jgi:hypothetical protein
MPRKGISPQIDFCCTSYQSRVTQHRLLLQIANGVMSRFVTMAFLLHIAHYRRQSTCLFGRGLSNRLCRLACEACPFRLALYETRLDKPTTSFHQRQRPTSTHDGDLSVIMQSIKVQLLHKLGVDTDLDPST